MEKLRSIKTKMLAIVAVPSICLAIVVSIFTYFDLKSIYDIESERVLKAAAEGANVISTVHACDIEGMTNSIADYAEVTGVDLTITNGDLRVVTTVPGALDTRLSSNVVDILESTQQPYFSTDVNVNNEKYYGYYIPFVQEGKLIGSVFAGIPTATALEEIKDSVSMIILCAIVTLIVFLVIAYIILNILMRKLKATSQVVSKLAGYDLNIEEDTRFIKRHDEYEEIYVDTF